MTAPLRPLPRRIPWPPALVAVASAAALALALAFTLALALLAVAGASSFAVRSDSMQPAFSRGDLVVTVPVASLRVGEVVSFRKYGQVVTHRIVAAGRGAGEFETRGDANPGNDPWTITRGDVVGRVVGVVPRAGWPLLVAAAPLGRALVAGLLLAALAGMAWAWPRAVRLPARMLHPSAGYAVA